MALRFVHPLLQSLHPGYIPPGQQQSAQPYEGPAFTIGSADGQNGSLLQGIGLGARLVSPYTVLPAEIRTLLEGCVTLSAAARLKDQLGTTIASASGQSRADSSVDGSPTNDKGKKKKTLQQTPQRTSPLATASTRTGPLPGTSLALGALASLAAVGGSSATTPAHTPTSIPTTGSNATCAADESRCDNGECYYAEHQCDGDNDCSDGSDENCTQADCDRLEGHSHFCNDRCVDDDWVCDGEEDCGDGSDEKNCTQAVCDRLGRNFLCDDNKCIHSDELCDGWDNCGDRSDENCTEADCDRLGSKVFCDDKCVRDKFLCDDENNCMDGTDERAELCNPVSSSPTPPIATRQVFKLNNTESPDKIGTGPNHPPNGTYNQTTDIGASNLSQPISRSSGMAGGATKVPATPASVTETLSTVSNTTMNSSGLPGTITAVPAIVAGGSLSAGVIAAIAGAAVLTVVAGVCIYRHYHRRSSPADAEDLQELVTINAATQETVEQPGTEAFRGEARGDPAGEQVFRIPSPEPPGLKKTALPENYPC
ncbi:hypothetical protein [Endozoicomonas sp. ONNA2]|uniref:hypothetical protein n=1 Tax=Endozoicomonas sp. ONNA2 TaxID=2828741 RepID=UPI002148E26E|nr:hypothetical protein [Endozoicomonas sp. ONNA2]